MRKDNVVREIVIVLDYPLHIREPLSADVVRRVFLDNTNLSDCAWCQWRVKLLLHDIDVVEVFHFFQHVEPIQTLLVSTDDQIDHMAVFVTLVDD